MRIERIDGYLVRIPLKKEVRFADAPATFCESVVLRLEGEGAVGWSEVNPGGSPLLTSEWSGSAYLTLRDCVAPKVAELGSIATVEHLEEAFAPIKGNNHAKAAVELAWHDLSAKLQNKPLWKALGGEKKPVKLGLIFDRSVERETFFTELARAVADQFGRITLKMRPGWDVQVLNFARIDSPAWVQLQVDIEGGLDFDKHSDTLYRMDDFFLNFVEQPFNPRDFVVHAMLKDNLRTPICLDESIESIEDAKIALDLEACKFICLKAGRVGGLSNALSIAKLAKNNDVQCYSGFELGTSLSWRYALALASAGGFALPTDYARFPELFDYDLVEPISPVLVEEPGDEEKKRPPRSFQYAELWDEPGIGAEPDLEKMKPYILDSFTLSR